MSNINSLLQQKAKEIDISREVFNTQERYRKQLQEAYGDDWDLFPQGSVRLGTVINSPKADKGENFDIDIVAHHNTIKKNDISEKKFKIAGKPPVDSTVVEKKPCWTIQLANNISIDITPSINDPDRKDKSEKITRKISADNYEWQDSNPRGYYGWFKEINQLGFDKAYKKRLHEYSLEKAFSEKVLKPLVRTDLQRAIQVLKYMRDLSYNKTPLKEYKPVSIVITTIVAQLFKDMNCDANIEEIIKKFIQEMKNARKVKQHLIEDSMEKAQFSINPIKHFLIEKMEWKLPNPTDPDENFLNRWNEGEKGNKKAKEFFEWIDELDSLFQSYDKLKDFLYPPRARTFEYTKRENAPRPYYSCK